MADRDDPPETRRTLPKLGPPSPTVMGARLVPRSGADEPTRPDVPEARRAAHVPRRPTLTGSPAPAPPRPLPPQLDADITLQSPPDHDPTPPSGQALPPRQDGRRAATPPVLDTLKGIGPETPRDAAVGPPKSLSPAPRSEAVKVDFGGTKVEFRPSHLRKLGVWALTLAVGAGGGVAGKAGHDAVSEQGKLAADAERDRKIAVLSERVAELETSVQLAASKANRALVLGDDNDQKIQKLQREAIVVKSK
jgi:hypothetical protein